MRPAVPPSNRELECLKLFALGLSDAQIAHRLAIAPRTVRYHFDGIRRKLEANSRTHALVLALQVMLINLNELSPQHVFACGPL
jgi:DNA-binding CsgD family transcriptional regulator